MRRLGILSLDGAIAAAATYFLRHRGISTSEKTKGIG